MTIDISWIIISCNFTNRRKKITWVGHVSHQMSQRWNSWSPMYVWTLAFILSARLSRLSKTYIVTCNIFSKIHCWFALYKSDFGVFIIVCYLNSLNWQWLSVQCVSVLLLACAKYPRKWRHWNMRCLRYLFVSRGEIESTD